MGWTYAVVVHAGDDHYQITAQRLKDLARNESICIDIISPSSVAFDKNESTKMSEIIDKVWEARRAAGMSTLGVIFYGRGYECLTFSNALRDKIQSAGENNPIQLILSEGCSEWIPKMIADSVIPGNSMMLRPNVELVNKFDEDWATNFTKHHNLSSPSTPIEEYMKEFYKETGKLPTDITNITRSPLVSEAIDSIFVLAVAYLKAQKQKCGELNPRSNCDELKKMSRKEIVGYIQGLQATYDKLPGQAAPSEFSTAHKVIGHTQRMDVVMVNKTGNSWHIHKVGILHELLKAYNRIVRLK